MARPRKNNTDTEIAKAQKSIEKIKSDILAYEAKIVAKKEDLRLAEAELTRLLEEKERADKAGVLEILIREGYTIDEIKMGIAKMKENNDQQTNQDM